MTISDGETEQTMTDAELVQCVRQGDETWFILREPSETEVAAARVDAKIEYLAMMTGVDMGGVE